MNVTKKVFWREAVKGGTIIGLTGIAFALLEYALRSVENRFWPGLVWWADLIVFIALIYAFTRKISLSADRAQGFPYGRCVGFVLAMMLFYGILTGVYTAIFNNFIDPESALRIVDAHMAMMQDMVHGDEFDMYYATMKASVFNPIMVTLGGILAGAIRGLIVGLITSAFVKRDPDIFGPREGVDDNIAAAGNGTGCDASESEDEQVSGPRTKTETTEEKE